jgi:NADPH oxidase
MQKAGFKYVPGQWVFFQMPEVSRFQWHPFTISSAPDDPYISIHVRQVGDFTRAVGTRLGATPQLMATLNKPSDLKADDCGEFHDITTIKSRDLPIVRIDGPYGSPAQDVFQCEVAILIGAGIGVTPFSSILKNI